jgi:uncharacterized protein (TIGR04255 family)
MSRVRHYRKPPITEAIIDLQVAPSPGEKLSVLDHLNTKEPESYPQKDPIFEMTGVFEFQPTGLGSTQSQRRQAGYRYANKDGNQVWQARLGGFTFSQLAPYDRWEPFRDEARRRWGDYRRSLAPECVNRIAVRYVNRIDIPNGSVDLKDYFRTSPEIAPEVQQSLSGFFMRLQIPQTDIKGEVLFTQTIVPPQREGSVSVVLDIDLFRTLDIPKDDEDLWGLFEILHDRKNEVFEASITDRTRELFQ